MRVYLFYGMVVMATLVTFYFADVAPFGCCRGPYQGPNQEQPSQNTDEKAGEEQPKQGSLLRPAPMQPSRWAKHSGHGALQSRCVETSAALVCGGAVSL